MITQTKYRNYDSESDYYAMGYRMYSAEFGRFLAVDPLFEAMSRQNPYHYSFNSPMFWSDPSGLAPVKEKVKNSEKLLSLYSGIEACKSFNQTVYEEPFTAWAYANARLNATDIDEILNGPSAHEVMESHFGGASGSAGSADNGVRLTENMKNNIRSHFSFCYDNDENVPEVLKERFFDELFGRIGEKITKENYEFLTSVDHTINLYSPEGWFDFLKNQEDLSSWWDILIDNIGEFFGGEPHKPQYGMAYSGNHNLHFQAEMFTNDDFKFGGFEYTYKPYKWVEYYIGDIIIHELGHSWALFTNGSEYNNWNWRFRENWAIQYNNEFRIKRNLLPEPLNSTWFLFWGGKNAK